MLARMPQLLPLKPTSPLPILSGEYGQALLCTYENICGPAIGADIAYAVELYAKDGGYFPPRHAGHEGLKNLCCNFRAHLRRNAERFRMDFGAWIEKTRASFPPLKISADEAEWRMRETRINYLLHFFDNATRFHETCAIPVATALAQTETLGSAIQCIPVAQAVEEYRSSNDKLRNTFFMKRDAFHASSSISSNDDVEMSHRLHHGQSALEDILDSPNEISALLTEVDDDVDVQSLSEKISSWFKSYASFAVAVHREHLVHTLERIDRDIISPLENLITPYRNGGNASNLQPLSDALKDGGFIKTIHPAMHAAEEIANLWNRRLHQPPIFPKHAVAHFGKLQAYLSRIIHDTAAHNACICCYTMSMVKICANIQSAGHDDACTNMIRAFQSTIDGWRNIMEHLSSEANSPLEHAKGLGARIVMKAQLPGEIDNSILQSILDRFIGNAVDINNKFPREYPDGEEFEIVVTVRANSTETRDNGPGTTSERLAEVRQAIKDGAQLESDHDGTGCSLAVDVGKHLLPKLFPGVSDTATLTIDSTLGVGWTVTIHYPESIVEMAE
jgi:hypothetical protein